MKTRIEELKELIAKCRRIIRHDLDLLTFQQVTNVMDDLQKYTIELYECEKMNK